MPVEFGAKRGVSVLVALALVLGLLAAGAGVARAEGLDYEAPAEWLLPWRGGDVHRVTWGPEDHWANGKATGIAFDVTMLEGVPIYAPADGVAHFRQDARLLSTTLGNYVDLRTEDGWLVRLAHLRDERLETRPVKAGELLGYAGMSGVSASHLHVEVLILEDGIWRCPDSTQLDTLFGRPLGAFVPGALVVNHGCAGMLVSDGEARTLTPSVELGNEALVLVPLRNEGDRVLDLTGAQLVMESPLGETILADAEGDWRFPARSQRTLALRVHPDLAGVWQATGLRYVAGQQTCALDLEGTFMVEALPITTTSLDLVSAAIVGSPLEIALTLWNTGSDALEADDLLVWGEAPDGAIWQATLGEPVRLEAAGLTDLLLRNGPVLGEVGPWRTSGVALVREGRAFRVALAEAEIEVSGPQLAIESLSVHAADRGPIILVRLANLGDEPIRDARLELWGWYGLTGGDVASATTSVDELWPGQSSMLRLQVQATLGQGEWRLAGAGYWLDDAYLPLTLPAAPLTLVLD